MEIVETESKPASFYWRKAMVGALPPDFLRIVPPADPQQQQQPQCPVPMPMLRLPQNVSPNHIGRLSITCAQARLVRNYGITRMDPYVRIRVGYYVIETQTDANGGKNPCWNRVIQSQLAAGVNSIYIEIFDECSFKMDELIAWCEIKIPENVLRGETHEEWYPLSGKQGVGLEGTIYVVLSFSNQPIQPYMYPAYAPAGHMHVIQTGAPAVPVYVAPQQPQQMPSIPMPPPQLSEADFNQIQEMFPNIEGDVIKSVFTTNHGNKDATINCLLQMNENSFS